MIHIKISQEIAIMAEAGKILAKVIKQTAEIAKPGITTKELDKAAESLIFSYGCEPAFKGYNGFPTTLCASVNNVIVHGVPSDYKLKQGDILSLDLGLKYKGTCPERAEGFFSDMAITVPIGEIEPEAQRLMRVTKKSLKMGIKKARPGNTFGDIGNTIQRYVESQGFSIVRELCGHGIGKDLHEDPEILNYGKRHKGEKIKQGMVICLEPLVSAGNGKMKKGADGHSFETQDNSLSAHFEHMLAITETSNKILTITE